MLTLLADNRWRRTTLEALLGHDIQYYATINFQGLKDAVDAIGGVPLPIQEGYCQ
jgi:anionic cell wall polymer biosynthesis LytR-Cps2A-Psr (LCP) family protein